MTFRVGQNVVCVYPTDDLVSGNVYEITNIGAGFFTKKPMVDVAGSKFQGLAFYAKRFRPLSESKTDISIFTAMLTGKRVDA
jgi:hypothetical protein